mmetsp:Transcript_8793/g.19922  ORF Transcript_8793/g.19922 Transcript_8793/m.19922 type:complete len:107 (+) Transcript_8793:119-439(+)
MSVYEEVSLADMRFDEEQLMYFYTCPCGDLFEISLEELHDGEDIALCPSCSLKLRVRYEESDLPPLPSAGDASAPHRSPGVLKAQPVDPEIVTKALKELECTETEE